MPDLLTDSVWANLVCSTRGAIHGRHRFGIAGLIAIINSTKKQGAHPLYEVECERPQHYRLVVLAHTHKVQHRNSQCCIYVHGLLDCLHPKVIELLYTSIEARLWRDSLLGRMGNGARVMVLRWQCFLKCPWIYLLQWPTLYWWCFKPRQARDHDSGPLTAMPCQCFQQQCIKWTMKLTTCYRTVTITIHVLQCMQTGY